MAPAEAAKRVLPFPVQNTATAPIRRRAGAEANVEHMSMWAGAEYEGQCRPLGAGDLMAELERELDEASKTAATRPLVSAL